MRLYAKLIEPEDKCPSCNWETTRVFVLADSFEEAEELIARGTWLCGECMSDLLSESDYEIRRLSHARSRT